MNTLGYCFLALIILGIINIVILVYLYVVYRRYVKVQRELDSAREYIDSIEEKKPVIE